ncbi:MAG: hypothetical protein QM537_09220 [Candidatus Symbiobacter sp.]|nr:hypothetical protein [Candidatus Symbiobacter sp.]
MDYVKHDAGTSDDQSDMYQDHAKTISSVTKLDLASNVTSKIRGLTGVEMMHALRQFPLDDPNFDIMALREER